MLVWLEHVQRIWRVEGFEDFADKVSFCPAARSGVQYANSRRVFACVLDDDTCSARVVFDEIGHIVHIPLSVSSRPRGASSAHVDDDPAVTLFVVLLHLLKANQLLSAWLFCAGHLFSPRAIVEQHRSGCVRQTLR